MYRYFVSFAAMTLCVTSQQVFVIVVIYFVMTQSGNFWIYLHIENKLWRQTTRHEEEMQAAPLLNLTSVTHIQATLLHSTL
jgi:hypothetical protein